jgi:hypothetical protein
MKKLALAIIVIMVFVCPNYAQFTTVTYDVDKNWFNEGQTLPAEKSMNFKGILPQNIERIEINILTSKGDNHLYQATAKKQINNEFSLPVNYKLRASDKYDFQIDFFKVLSEEKKSALKDQIIATLDTYIDVNLSGDKSIKLLKKPGKTVKEMNKIVEEALILYRSPVASWRPEFSQVVRLKLEQLDKSDLDKDYVKGDTSTTRHAVRQTARQQLVNELKAQVNRETEQLFDVEMLVLSESKMIDNYPTESKENGLSINVGYGGVYLAGNWENMTYGAAPYVGLAFPLGNSILGSKFLRNSSFTLGFFLEDFEDEKNNPVTGFLVDKPIYLGLDYKLFKFIRINTGVAFLEGTKHGDPNNPEVITGKKVMIRPFVGLSARIDLRIGLGK